MQTGLRRIERMKKGIILYKSKYGSTKKYAEWLAEECGFDLTGLRKPT